MKPILLFRENGLRIAHRNVISLVELCLNTVIFFMLQNCRFSGVLMMMIGKGAENVRPHVQGINVYHQPRLKYGRMN